MTTDLLLACGHHLLAFAILGLIMAELFVLRAPLRPADVQALAKLDRNYGLAATLLILVGVSRVVWGVKGQAYYTHNHFFWLKMASFAAVGLLSIVPTVRILRWAKAQKTSPQFTPADGEVARVRRYLILECIAFALIPIFAATMARGFGF